VALERGAGEEWVTEEWTAFQARFETANRRRGREGEREGEGGGVRPRECHTARGSVVGPDPNWRAAPGSGPSAARTGDVRRAHVTDRKQIGGGLTGGLRHSVGRWCR
jgi:hypothetical protein